MLPHMVDTPISYKNFKPLAQVNNDTAAITVRADAKWLSLKEFIDDAKANPGTIKMGHGGVGTVWHLVMASIEKETGAKFNQVPFESGGATVPALLGGHIDAVPISYAEVKANVDSGKLRTLALVDSKIADGVPKLKTLEEELGIKAEITGAWRGLAVPKDTPDDIAKILGDAFSKAVGDTEFKEFMLKNGLGIEYKDAKGFEALLEENHNAFGKIIPELGLKK